MNLKFFKLFSTRYKVTGFIVLLLIGGIILGPVEKFDSPVLLETDIDIPLTQLDQFIADKESKIIDLKPDNQARVIWANPEKKHKTEYAVVYLHGFSASQKEGDPIHHEFASRYGFNLYLPRLEDHGRIDSNSFSRLTPDNFIQSAEDAVDIGKLLGEKVILISCSTGGTLSAILASAGEHIHSMIMYSPNIDIFDPLSDLLLYPWGKRLSALVMKGHHNRVTYDSLGQAYWNSVYHTNALFALKTMIQDFMKEDHFKKIKVPVFVGYYYKDEENQDKVVSVKRMLDFYDQIGTPAHLKQKTAFPQAGGHVISSEVFSKDIEGVKMATFSWAEKVLKIKPVRQD